MNGTCLCLSYLTMDTSCTSSHWIPAEVYEISIQFSSVVQSCLNICDPMNCSTPGLSITDSQSSLKLMFIESVMPSSHLILCRPLLLLPSIFLSIRVFSNESVLHIRWPKDWSFSFNISPSNEYSELISFKTDCWISLLSKGLSRVFSNTTVQKPAFFMVQLSNPYMTTGKTMALTRWTFLGMVFPGVMYRCESVS